MIVLALFLLEGHTHILSMQAYKLGHIKPPDFIKPKLEDVVILQSTVWSEQKYIISEKGNFYRIQYFFYTDIALNNPTGL